MRWHSSTVDAIGFSTSTCLPAFERCERGRGVVVPGRDDGESVDLRVFHQLAIVRAGAGHAVLARHLREAFLRRVAKCCELEFGMAGDDPAMHRSEPADPDHADA